MRYVEGPELSPGRGFQRLALEVGLLLSGYSSGCFQGALLYGQHVTCVLLLVPWLQGRYHIVTAPLIDRLLLAAQPVLLERGDDAHVRATDHIIVQIRRFPLLNCLALHVLARSILNHRHHTPHRRLLQLIQFFFLRILWILLPFFKLPFNKILPLMPIVLSHCRHLSAVKCLNSCFFHLGLVARLRLEQSCATEVKRHLVLGGRELVVRVLHDLAADDSALDFRVLWRDLY